MEENFMFKEQMNKIKSLVLKKTDESEEGEKPVKTNKRKIENLVVFLVIAIVTLIAINAILSNGEKDVKKDEDDSYKILADIEKSNKNNYDDELEKRLENILETMVGVRKS